MIFEFSHNLDKKTRFLELIKICFHVYFFSPTKTKRNDVEKSNWTWWDPRKTKSGIVLQLSDDILCVQKQSTRSC